MKQSILRLFTCLILGVVFGTTAWAQSMGKQFEVNMTLVDYNNVLFPKSAVLADAKSIKITVTHCNYVKLLNGSNQMAERSWDNDKTDAVFNLSGTDLTVAKNGNLYIYVGGKSSDSQVLVTNYDTESGAANDIGGSTSGGFTGDKKGGYTAEELKAKYNPIDMDKVKLIISKKRQITHLPTVYITIPDAASATTQEALNAIVNKDGGVALYHSASIKVVDDNNESLSFDDDVLEIKVRGNETAKGDKKPYRLKFGKDVKDAEGNVIESHKHDMLGLGYAKRNWTLIANQKDPSFCHNALSYHIGKAVGMEFCPGYRFVDLVINNIYLGCYMISDHIEVGSNRIKLEDENTGWYVESNRDDQVEEPYVSAGGILVTIKSPEPATDAETAALKAEVAAFFDAAQAIMNQKSNSSVFCDPENGWRKYFDEESLVKYYVGTNLSGNHDGFMTVKMYRDMGKKIKVGPLWDHDTAFGIYDDGKTLSEDAQSTAPLFCGKYAKIIADNDPEFMQKANYLLQKVLADGYADNMKTHIADITSSVATSRTIESPYSDPFQTEIDKLENYITAHNAWLSETVDAKAGGKTIVFPEVPVTPPAPTRAQLTNLPTIYLDATTINGEWQQAAVEVFDKENKLYQGATWKKEGLSKKGNINVSVQYQGSGAAGSKNSYRLKFNDKINLLTADGLYKQWVLLANDDDPSMLNNALAKELGDAIGMPWTPGYQYVDLYVNNTYMGTYQVTDRVKAEEGRSLVAGGNKDLDWQVRFNDDTELAEDGTKDYISGSGVNTIYRNPDPKDITADALATLKADMSTYFNGLFAETSTGKFENFAANVDQEQLVNWYIAQEILGVYKGFSSIEAYRSVTATDQKLHFGPLWDNEKAFGNTGNAPSITNAMSDLDTEGSHNGLMIEYSAFPKMNKVFQYLWTQEWFSTAVLNKWATLYNGNVNEGLAQKLRNYAASRYSTISQLSQPKNLEVWPNSLEYNSSTHAKYADFIDAYKAIGTYINQRFPYLDKKFKEMAVEACEHVVDRYQDNHDGTHTPICKKCNSLIVAETAIHNYKAENGHPLCSLCYTTENNAAIEGTPTNGDKVYRIVESENSANIKYVTAKCGFAPSDNSIYISNEEISEESNLTNVAWPRTADDEYNANAIVLKDKAYPYDDETKAKSIHAKSASYSRNMSSTWGTLCLPFKIASCDDYTLYSITSTNLNDDGTGTLVFDEIKSAKGHMPVVFRKNTDATTVTFRGVPQDKAGADYNLVTVKKSKKFTNSDAIDSKTVAGSGTWDLYGNVKKDNTAKIATYPNIYYISQNKFWHATEDVKVATFRAVFVFTPEPGAENAAKSMMIAVGDDDATGIQNKVINKNLAIFTGTGEVILQSNYDTRVYIYNVNGTKVANTNLEKDAQQRISLPKGVYIINGTKVVVK